MNKLTFLIFLLCSLCWANAASISKKEDQLNDDSEEGSNGDGDDDDDNVDKVNKVGMKKLVSPAQFVPKRGPLSGVRPERRQFMQSVVRQPIPMSPLIFRMFGPNRRKAWFSRFGG